MSDEFENEHFYRCPTCGREDKILVKAIVQVALTREGTDEYDDEVKDGDTEYDEDSTALCASHYCDWQGKLWQCQKAYEEKHETD